jgi:hypothetical protein
MLLRSCFLALAALVLSAGFSGSHADSYKHVRYPKSAFGNEAYIDTRWKGYHPSVGGVTCDRSRDICYDRYGISYHATKRYIGDREANRAYRKYGDRVFLFPLGRGVVCDRRTDRCIVERWTYHSPGGNGVDLWRNKGAAPPRWYQHQHQHQQPNWR